MIAALSACDDPIPDHKVPPAETCRRKVDPRFQPHPHQKRSPARTGGSRSLAPFTDGSGKEHILQRGEIAQKIVEACSYPMEVSSINPGWSAARSWLIPMVAAGRPSLRHRAEAKAPAGWHCSPPQPVVPAAFPWFLCQILAQTLSMICPSVCAPPFVGKPWSDRVRSCAGLGCKLPRH